MKSNPETATILGAPRLHFGLKAMRIMTDRLYVDPGENDVLCGRGRQFYEHQGNIRFRELIERTLPYYAQAETKGEKTGFVRQVVGEISDKGGRFLKLDKISKRWYEGDSVCAKSKVGHAFRDAIAEKQQQQQHVQHESQSSSSDSDGEGNELEREPPETEVSKGATSLLMMLREPASKTGNDGLEQNEKGDYSKIKLKSDQTHEINVPQKRSDLPSKEFASRKDRPIDSKRPNHGVSNELGAPLPDGFATVKHAMLNNLLLRQMALAKGINFQSRAENAASDVDESSRESSSSSRASASSLLAHQFASLSKDHQAHMSSVSNNPVGLQERKSAPDKPFDLPSNQRGKGSLHDGRSNAPEYNTYLTKKMESRSFAHDHPKDITRQQNSNAYKGQKPTASGIVPRVLTPPPLGMMFSGPSRMPTSRMLDSAELKRAMLKTLAQRQSALARQQGQSSSRGHIQDMINLVNSGRVPPSAVLHSTTAGRSSSDVSKGLLASKSVTSVTVSRGVVSPVREGLGHEGHLSERLRTPSPSLHYPVTTHNVISDSRSPNMKRQRSTPSSRQQYNASQNAKKPRALSELAHENTLQSDTEPCYPCSQGLFDNDDDDSEGEGKPDLYFL